LTQSASTVRGALRGVAIAITLVSIITFATVGYSGYQVFETVTSASFGSLAHEGEEWSNGTLTFSAVATFPNNGLYPIQVSTSFYASTPSGSLGGTSSPTMTIVPSTSGTLNLTLSLDPYAVGGATAGELFYQGSNTTLALGISASMVPFAALKLAENSSLYIAPFVGNLSVSSAANTPSGFVVHVDFVNHETAPLTYAMYTSLAPGGNSTVVQGTLLPEAEGSAQFVFSGVTLAPGSYQVTLHTRSFGADLTIPLEVVAA